MSNQNEVCCDAVTNACDKCLDVESILPEYGSMKTTIDIPDEALRDAFRFTRAKTKRAAIVTAVEDFNRRRRMAEAAQLLGGSETFMSHADLMKSRLRGRDG
jgi:Arc/MetJ family transcription regulator